MRKAIRAEFGNVAILRARCPNCHETALVIQGRMACCGANPFRDDEYIRKKEAEGERRRSSLTIYEKREIISQQAGLCFYCQHPFGTPVWHPGRQKVIIPEIHFDHFVCWDFSRDSSYGNMVAACSICNFIKGNKIFSNEDDARAFIRHRIGEKGYEFHVELDRPWETIAEERQKDPA